MRNSLLLLLTSLVALSQSICEQNFVETVCKDIEFNPDDDDATLETFNQQQLVISNCSGRISAKNFAKITNNNVTELTFASNNFKEIGDSALCSIQQIQILNIIRNNKNFPRITPSLLKNCGNLKKITLNDVSLETSNLFSSMPALESLSINNSLLIPDNVLTKQFLSSSSETTLQSLTIAYSNLERISEDAFEDLASLKNLDLLGNKLESIPQRLFAKLENLIVLNLAENNINNFTWNEFNGLKSLKVLYLEGNPFETVRVKHLVEALPSLERVFFTQTKLTPETRKTIQETLTKLKINFIYIGPAPLF